MASKRKFYRTVYKFELLTEEEPGSLSLEDLHYLTTEGHGSGQFLSTRTEVVGASRAANLLRKQGSDPEFFLLDEKGNDIDPFEESA